MSATKKLLEQAFIPVQMPVEYETCNIQCPNCDKYGLIRTDRAEYNCPCCGQDFIMVEKTIRFK